MDWSIEKAFQFFHAKQFEKAEIICRYLINRKPDQADAFHLLGLIAFQLGRKDTAATFIKRAIQVNPENPFYYNNLGVVLVNRGESDDASDCYRKALRLMPGYAEASNNLGVAYANQDRLTEALICHQNALILKTDYAEAYYNLGNVFVAQDRLKEAIPCYQTALHHKPDYAQAWFNLGGVFLEQGGFEDALSCYHKTLDLRSNYAEAHNNIGIVLTEQGRFSQAIYYCKEALRLKPDHAESCNHLVDLYQRTCQWDKLGALQTQLDTLTQKASANGTKVAVKPFQSLKRHMDPVRNFDIARSWSLDLARRMSRLNIHFPFNGRRSHKTKIRVGYLSNDFRDHPVSHQIAGLFGYHCRDEFEIFGYSHGIDDGSAFRHRIERDCDRFFDLRGMSIPDMAGHIYRDQVDILVDLMGYTRGNRLGVCALRPAPIQVSYLGFLGTSGADFFDYIITDRIVTPVDQTPYYSEKFVYLPNCYQVNDVTRPMINKTWNKDDFDLPPDAFVFCSFNQAFKIDPEIFDIWMKILHQVPQSIIWLARQSESTMRNLRKAAEERGVNPERLIFAEILSLDEHLVRLKFADLALDTRIYNGGATTSNALWAGVPVIAMRGSHFVSRMSASSLTAVGLSELIVSDLHDYETLAVRLAFNPHELKRIRRKLAENRSTAPLFDTVRFVKNLEHGYKKMWELFLAGKRPELIEVIEN